MGCVYAVFIQWRLAALKSGRQAGMVRLLKHRRRCDTSEEVKLERMQVKNAWMIGEYFLLKLGGFNFNAIFPQK